jgi:membrane protein implicated in regulation of membrane protease activity
MRRKIDKVSENIEVLGSAGLDLAKAELFALSEEFRLTGKGLLRVALLVAICLFTLFWAIALLVFLGVEVGALWLPRWMAALIVLGLLLLVVAALVLVARKRWRRLESPGQTVRRRLDEHRDWWRRRIVEQDGRRS